MDAVRVSSRLRLGPLFEWLIAAAFLLATIAVASLVVREVQGPARVAAAVTPARPLVSSIPPAVPCGSRCDPDDRRCVGVARS